MLLILALAAAVSGSPVDPSAPTPEVRPTPVTKKDDPNRMICTTEIVTGSHFTRKVCMTKAEKDNQQRQLEVFERDRQNANGLTAGPGNAMDGH